MIEMTGKYNTAKVYCDNVEETAVKQIQTFLNNEAFADGQICIMPDVHAGTGSVIGFTYHFDKLDKVIPNIIGVDIGCTVSALCIGKVDIDFPEFDNQVRRSIPSGYNIRQEISPMVGKDFQQSVTGVCSVIGIEPAKALKAIGSLGGGNHYVELNKDQDDNIWICVHSGSRNFGYQVANYHQSKAKDQHKNNPEIVNDLEYLTGSDAELYIEHMKVAQQFAVLNHRVMLHELLSHYFRNDQPEEIAFVQSIHNFIDFKDNTVRKGAISAHAGEHVLIPFNMATGSIIGRGTGNKAWNNSAPHGAGRLMSRTKAKKELPLSVFIHKMENVWSSCVSEKTLDESPMAYKNPEDIMKYLGESVEVISHLKPIYNFKAQ